MSRLVVFTFDAPECAIEARTALKDLEKRRVLGLDDAVVVAREGNGQLYIHRDVPPEVTIGAIVGALLGLLLTFVFLFSVVFGAAAGALIGRLLVDQRVTRESIEDVEEALGPGTSSLLILIRTGDADAMMAAVAGFRPRIFQSTLPPEIDARLRGAL